MQLFLYPCRYDHPLNQLSTNANVQCLQRAVEVTHAASEDRPHKSTHCRFCYPHSVDVQILEPSNVKRIVEEADGYQPHLIAPEMGYRRLLQECLVLFKGPADTAVGEVHHVLRSIVASTINSEDCKNLQQYTSLKREIVATASSSLGELCVLVCIASGSWLHCLWMQCLLLPGKGLALRQFVP